jgi:Tfp pilus assembly protein PilO
MNNSKKTILITLIPAVLTLYFISQVLFPAIGNYNALREKFNETKAIYQETQAKIEQLQNNKKLLKETEELNNQVADFDIQMPPEFEDEFFLVDLDKFSITTETKIISLNSKKEKEIEINISNGEKDKNKTSGKKKKSKKKKAEQQIFPLTIYEKPFEIKTQGHYNQVISFVSSLENYQRKFIINGVSAQISKNDDKNPDPKIELTIEGSTFKAVKNIANSESEKPE